MSDDEPEIHPLLARQIRRVAIDDPSSPPDETGPWQELLARVARTYESADRDRYLLERSLDLSSAEMQELHTQLAEDKEILDSVLGALSSGVCHLDPDWRIRFVNAAARRQLHLFDDTNHQAFSSFSFRTTSGDELEPARIERILVAGRPVVEEDILVIRTDGTTFPASVTFNPMLRDGELAGIVISIVDITDRKHAQKQIEEARVEAAAAERARQAQAAFLANMSHELRTPLNAILGYSELILEDAEAFGYEELEPDLHKIRTAGRHLLSLINDVLDMSKIQAGRLDLNVERTDVASLLSDVADTLQPAIRKNGNVLDVEIEKGVGPVQTDHLRLKQVLLNVAGNAGKFTTDGRVTLRARTEEDAVVLEVEDTGIGMARETVEDIFEPFTQADTSTTRRYGGTGLGLAITRSLCDSLQIEVDIETAPGEGTTFSLRVPVQFGQSGAGRAASSGPIRKDQQTILFIDDDPSSHALVTGHLAEHSVEVTPANTGAEGVRLAREASPDAIILDISLPDVDGWEVLSILKSDPETSDIPLLVVSRVADARRAFQLGAQDYLVKPVERARLLAILRRYRVRSRPSRVMVVEDDDDLRHLLCRKIERETDSWNVLQASSGHDAYRQLEEGELPDLMLLDLMMPEMDGFELLARMRDHGDWDDIPVVVVTAMELTATQRNRLDERVETIVEKGDHSPIEIAETVLQTAADPYPNLRSTSDDCSAGGRQ